MKNMKLVVGERYSLKAIKGCSSAICECGHVIGIPKKYLKEVGQWFDIVCPVCGHEIQFFASLESCYE